MSEEPTVPRRHRGDGAIYSLHYMWPRNRVIVHVDRELSPQSALNLADSLRYFAETARCDGERDWCDACEAKERAICGLPAWSPGGAAPCARRVGHIGPGLYCAADPSLAQSRNADDTRTTA